MFSFLFLAIGTSKYVIMTGNQPLIVTSIVYAMTKMIDPSVGNDTCKMCISVYYFDKPKYKALKIALLYYYELAYSPNNDP